MQLPGNVGIEAWVQSPAQEKRKERGGKKRCWGERRRNGREGEAGRRRMEERTKEEERENECALFLPSSNPRSIVRAPR